MYESCYVPTLFRRDQTGCGWMVEGDRAVSSVDVPPPHSTQQLFQTSAVLLKPGAPLLSPMCLDLIVLKTPGHHSCLHFKIFLPSPLCLSVSALPLGQPKYSEFCLFYCKTCYLTSFLDFIKNLSLGAFLLQSTHIFLTSSLRKITIRHDFHSVLPISLLSFHPMPRDVAFTLNTRCPWKCQLTTA